MYEGNSELERESTRSEFYQPVAEGDEKKRIFLKNKEEDYQRQIAFYQQREETYQRQIAEYQRQVVEYQQQVVEYKQQARYWEAQFNQLKERSFSLEKKVEELQAQLHKREQQLFGKSSEQGASRSERSGSVNENEKGSKKRGQQKGSPGHGRRDYSHLPTVEETIELPPEETRCPSCGLPYEVLVGTENSEILEIQVKAHRRLIRRKVYRRCCSCEGNTTSRIILAPLAERLLPKSKLGVSIWAMMLISKFVYQHPLNRVLAQMEDCGLSLSVGTVVDGFRRLVPLFVPIYDAMIEKNIAAEHWHADETGWKVFETVEGKKNHQWYLWVFHSQDTVAYKIYMSRAAKALTEHFGEDHPGGTLSVDRYVAYKTIAKKGLFILAFCWAHVRRDFLEHSKAYPNEEEWGLSWVERINKLYHINNQRIEHDVESKHFRQFDDKLKKEIDEVEQVFKKQIQDSSISDSAKKLLVSLGNHWDGLTIFVDRPEIPMDNNKAERSLRSSVIGRKNYYGSGSVWSGELAAALFTIFGTLKLWGINVHTWLLAYFQECAMLGGQAPADIRKFLPWEMMPELKQRLSEPPRIEDSG